MRINELKEVTHSFTLLYIRDENSEDSERFLLYKELFDTCDVVTDTQEALYLYEKHYDEYHSFYDIVIIDVVLPKILSLNFIKNLLKIHTKQKLIVSSQVIGRDTLIRLLNMGVSGYIDTQFKEKEIFPILYDICCSFGGNNFIDLGRGFTYFFLDQKLMQDKKEVHLTKNERSLLKLFLENPKQTFDAVEIFSHIYFDKPNKEFSSDAIKSLFKRIRKKLPINFFSSYKFDGYNIKLP